MTQGSDIDARSGLTLARTFFDRVDADPGRDAIVAEGSTISYGELAERITGMAAAFVAADVAPGETVGVSVGDEADHLVASMALIFLGAAQVNIPAHETDANKRALASRTGARKLVTDRPPFDDDGLQRIAPRPAGALPAGSPWQPFEPDSVAVYRTTSGTTGAPKAFGLSVRRLVSAAERLRNTPALARVLRTSSMDFDSTRVFRIMTILAGNSCMFLSELAPARLARFCAAANVSEVQIGTEKLKGLLRHPEKVRLPASTRVLVGGSRVAGTLRREARALTESLWVSYATSEVGLISFAPPEQHEAFPEGLGDPIVGVTVEILTDAGEPVVPGEIGRARIAKAAMPDGYLGGSDGGTSLADGWFYSHDLLSWPAGGPLLFHGRADDVMILNGIKIFPSAIEDALEAHPDVREAVAYPITSNVHGDIPVAAVTLRDDAAASVADLIRHCREAIGIAYPRRVFVVDAIPRTDTGKPLRRSLPVA